MKYLHILLNRIQSHRKNHTVALTMYIIGVFACVLFFIFYYGEHVKVSRFAESVPGIMATYTVSFDGGVSPDDERVSNLSADYEITLYHTAEIDIEASSPIFSESFIEREAYTITYKAHEADKYEHRAFFGSVDWSGKNDSIVFTSADESLIYSAERYKNIDAPYICLDGKTVNIIGVHNYGYESCVPYEYFLENGILADIVEVTVDDPPSKTEADDFASYLRSIFPEAKVETAYDIYGESYLNGEAEHRVVFMLESMLLLMLALFTFMFLAKYLFDMSKHEDVVYRMVGASISDVGLIALGEVFVLTFIASLLALIAHLILKPYLFDLISQYPNQSFSVMDYALVLSSVLLVSVIVCVPFVIEVCRRSVVSTKTNIE